MTKNVLMLHGLAQSGDYFASKTKGFRAEMEKLGYKLYYPTAPNEFPPADVPDFLGEVIADAPGDGENTGVLAWLENDPPPVAISYRRRQSTIYTIMSLKMVHLQVL